MENRNQDLPLVVSEILIEMHGMKDEMREVKTALQQMATLMLKQQGHTNEIFQVLMDENRKNTEMMIGAFREEGLRTREQFAKHDERLARIEEKLS